MKKFVEIEDNPEQTKIYLRKLDQMATYGDLSTCRRKYLLNYFDEDASNYCGNCDICLTRVELVNGTIAAQKVLSAVARLQERFGAGYVIDILRGSNAAKIPEDHKQLKTFGIGADISKEDWNIIIRDLLAQGYLAKSEGLYPLLTLTTKSTLVLKGMEQVMITKSKEKIEVREQQVDYETSLFQHLKDVRRQLASEENVPAYIVLSDASLLEIATYLPHNNEELKKISGFGDVKIQKYGKPFYEAVADYCTKRQLQSRIHLKAPKRQRNARPERDTDTKQQSLDLHKKGFSIEKIAEVRGLSTATVESHLAFYIQKGKLNIEDLVEPTKVANIQQAIEKVGGEILTPLKESLGAGYGFGEIKWVLAHLEFSKASLSNV
jgi:ATP-dependent DNA helicase RecQ